MNVLFVLKITGLRGFFSPRRSTNTAARIESLAEPLAPLGPPLQAEEAAAPAFSYTTADSNTVYCASVRLARGMNSARGVNRHTGGLADLSMRIHSVGIKFGLENGIPAEKIVGAFDTIEQAIGAARPEIEGQEWNDDIFVTWALPLLFAFVREGGDGLAEWFRPAPPMPEALEEELRAKLDAAARSWSPLPDGHDVVTVSTTDEVVRIHHGNADPYEIALSRIPSPMALCRWATHLGEKTWITAKTIRTFIATVAGVKGWDLYENPAPQQPAA